MKKTLLVSVSALLLLSSCGTYTGMGAYTGGTFGSIIGSAIGGISGGRHGSDVGTLIGMAGGAMVGAAVGAAADNAQQREYEQYKADRQQRMENRQRNYRGQVQTQSQESNDVYDDQTDSGFDPSGSGDDRLYGFGEDFSSVPSNVPDGAPAYKISTQADLEIRNPRILDASRDGELTRGEEARMVFEIYNCSSEPAFQVQPSVAEVTGNKHIRISENVLVECIRPGKGIRYTAVIKADDHLKEGEAVIRIGVFQRNKEITSQTREFRIKTNKR